MNDDDFELIMSPLCQTYNEDGIALQIEIYRSLQSDWTLELINPNNTSIVWDETFNSDQAALDEFHRTVRVDGMGSFLDDPETGAA